jgi:hypothetical protein
MSAWAWALALFCGGMLAVTAATQLRRWRWASWLKAHDACACIPSWTFFAPNPGVTDARLLWREQLVDSTVSPWHEVVPPHGGLLRALWNPTKRARKAVTDSGPMVVSLAARNPGSKLPMLSLPYLMIVQHVTALPGSPLSVARQFAVVRTQGADEDDVLLQLLFVSHWHRLAGEAPGASLPIRELPELAAPAH